MVARLDVDASKFVRLADVFAAAPRKAPKAIGRAVNRTGDMARTQVVRTLTTQTGLKRPVIVKAVKRDRAGGMAAGGLVYRLKSRGGNVSLKYFGARETRKGVSAAPWNKRRVFASTFLKGGRFPKRVKLRIGKGHVFARAGASRLPIEKKRSGLFIPTEMVTGATASAFMSTVRTVLPVRLRHELGAILGGYAPG